MADNAWFTMEVRRFIDDHRDQVTFSKLRRGEAPALVAAPTLTTMAHSKTLVAGYPRHQLTLPLANNLFKTKNDL
jgi:hypothetical protein